MARIDISVPEDLSRDDYERLVQIVADANNGEFKDEQIQRIETALDSALLAAEQIEDEIPEQRYHPPRDEAWVGWVEQIDAIREAIAAGDYHGAQMALNMLKGDVTP